MDVVAETVIAFLIFMGGIFLLVGSLGLAKLPDLMTRLHAPTKATTLGVGGALGGSMLYFLWAHGTLSIHEVLISVFLFLTAPVTAHFIAKAHLHLHQEMRDELPGSGRERGWSTYDSPPEPLEEITSGQVRDSDH